GGEELLGRLPGDIHLPGRLRVGEEGQQPAAAARVVELVEQVLDGAPADVQAEVLGGNVLQRVRLVEDDDAVVGQQAAAGAAQGQVAEEEGVVDDEELGPGHGPAGAEVEAAGVVGAGAGQAVAAVALDQVPHGRQRLERQVAAAAVLRLPRPAADLLELL